MSASPAVQLDYRDSAPDPAAIERYAARRAATNRAPPRPLRRHHRPAFRRPAAVVIDQLAKLSLHSSRLSRQFQKALDQLRDLQEERLRRQRHQLRDAAGILVHTRRKGIPWDPADDGFVFSKQQVQRHAQSLLRHQEAAHITCVLFGNPFRP